MRSLSLIAVSAIAIAAVLAGCAPSGAPSQPVSAITVKGSDTMVHLVTAWSEAYMKAKPDVGISVTGGGSGTGIAALLGKSTDVCSASREMSAEEKKKASEQGIVLQETVVARDGIAIVVHPSNPIAALDMEQIRKIYTGAVTQWDQVGGASVPVVPLSRESSSGTFIFFQEHVLNKKDFAANVRMMPATAAIVQSVADDAQSVGYVGLGYALEAGAKVKVLPIKKEAASVAVIPSAGTVRDGSYSIARPLYFYTGRNTPALAEFLKFCTGTEGQAIVKEAGYVALQ